MSTDKTKIVSGVTIQDNTLTPAKIDITPGGTASTTTSIVGSQTSNQTLTLPNATDTLVGKATTDTLSNKTIDTANTNTLKVNGNTLAATAGTATVTIPNSTDTLVGKNTTDTLTNKTIDTAGPNTIKINGNTLSATAGTATVTVPNSTDTLVGRSTTDTLINKTIDTAGPNTVKINGNTLSATAGTATVTIPNSTDTLVGRATTDTLTNKTLTTPVVDILSITNQGSQPTTPASGTTKLYVNNSSGKLTSLDSTGVAKVVGGAGLWVTGTSYAANDSVLYAKNYYVCVTAHTAGSAFETDLSSGNWQLINEPMNGKNYLSYCNFEDNDTGGFSLFNTTLTSGIPTGSITAGAASITTFNTTSSGALAGTYSLQTAIASGTITAGHGFISSNFTVTPEDKAKVLQVKFSYSATVGSSLLNFSGTSSNTFAVYIYDNANSAWIQPAGVYNLVQGSGVGQCLATFQTPSNATTMRVAIICINSNTSGAVTMLWDSFFCGPQITASGAAITDWVSYTPTFTGFGTVTNVDFRSRRVGNALEVIGYFTSGTVTATQAQITLGYNGSNGNVTTVSIPDMLIGKAAQNASASTVFTFSVLSSSSANYVKFGQQSSTTSELVAGNGTIFASTVAISMHFTVPIQGWSSNTVMSNDTDTRVVDAVVSQSGTQTVATATETVMTFNTITKDTHGAFASNKYTIPVSGDYKVETNFIFSAIAVASGTGAIYIRARKNGVSLYNVGVNSGGPTASQIRAIVGAGTIPNLIAGDYLEITIYQDTGTTLTTIGGITQTSFSRISGPATIAASAVVAFRKSNVNTATTYTNSTNADITWLNASTFDVDTHGGWNGTYYTIPVSGYYRITTSFVIASLTYSAGSQYDVFFADSANTLLIDNAQFTMGSGTGRVSGGTCRSGFWYNAGATIKPRFFQATGVSTTFQGLEFSIERLGGV